MNTPLVLSVAPALTMARFDSGRFAAYAQRERKRYGAESKGEGERFVGIFPPWAHMTQGGGSGKLYARVPRR